MKRVTNDSINIAGTAVEIALGLIGIMAMWLGVMKVAEQAGLIKIIASWLRPVTKDYSLKSHPIIQLLDLWL